jgi:hypothetical protein
MSTSPRKPRGDSRLKTLPEQDQLQVMAWLRANTQARVVELVQGKFGFSTNSASLSEFYSWWHFSRRLEQVRESATEFEATLKEMAAAGQVPLDGEKISQIGQAYFEQQAIRADDPALFAAMKRLRLKEADQSLALRTLQQKIREYEDKIAAARSDLTAASQAKGLSPEALKEIERALKMLS